MGALGIDLRGFDCPQCQQRRHQQEDGHDEHRAGGKQVPASAHGACGEAIADRGKAGVAAKSFADRGVADEAEADRGDCRAKYATRQ